MVPGGADAPHAVATRTSSRYPMTIMIRLCPNRPVMIRSLVTLVEYYGLDILRDLDAVEATQSCGGETGGVTPTQIPGR